MCTPTSSLCELCLQQQTISQTSDRFLISKYITLYLYYLFRQQKRNHMLKPITAHKVWDYSYSSVHQIWASNRHFPWPCRLQTNCRNLSSILKQTQFHLSFWYSWFLLGDFKGLTVTNQRYVQWATDIILLRTAFICSSKICFT